MEGSGGIWLHWQEERGKDTAGRGQAGLGKVRSGDEAAKVDLELSPEDVDYFCSVGNGRSGRFRARGGGGLS